MKLDKQFPVEQFEATVSLSTVPAPPLLVMATRAVTAPSLSLHPPRAQRISVVNPLRGREVREAKRTHRSRTLWASPCLGEMYPSKCLSNQHMRGSSPRISRFLSRDFQALPVTSLPGACPPLAYLAVFPGCGASWCAESFCPFSPRSLEEARCQTKHYDSESLPRRRRRRQILRICISTLK